MADHPNLPGLEEAMGSLFPGAGGALFRGSGLADRLTKDLNNQISTRPQAVQPVPTRGIDGPPAVNTGIQVASSTPSVQIPNAGGTSQAFPQTTAVPTIDNFPQLFSPAAGSLVSGSGILETLKRRLRPGSRGF